MAPPNDDIANAYALIQDGTQNTISLDSTAATLQTNEATFGEPQGTAWVKIDLSGYVAQDYDVPFDLVRTGGGAAFAPEFACFKVTDPTFDVNAPDFSKLSYLGGSDSYVGDGTTNPPEQTITFIGGTGSSSPGNRSETGIFYFAFNDYNYLEEGTADVTYTIPAQICIDAVDVINPDCPTASIVGGRVREDQDNADDLEYNPDNFIPTLKWTWAGAAGTYNVSLTGQMASTGNNGQVDALVKVNGVVVTGYDWVGQSPGDTTEFSWVQYGWYAGYDVGDYVTQDVGQYPYVYLSTGDTVEVMINSFVHLTGSPFSWVPFETRQVCFTKVNVTVPGTCTGRFEFPEDPLGDVWGSLNGWGGQRLIPDEIWVDIGVTPYNESDTPWGVNFVDFDFVPLPDGSVYCIFMDAYDTGTGSPTTPTDSRFYIVIKKYDPGSDSWSQVDTINIRPPTDKYPANSVSCAFDGTYIYFAWWEVTTYAANSPPAVPRTYQSDWHMVRLDPTNDSMTELGTGQHSVNVGTNTSTDIQDNAEIIGTPAEIAPVIVCEGDGGDVWVGVVEVIRLNIGNTARRPYVWRWDGATWTDLNLPTPTHIGTITPNEWEINGETGFYDKFFGMALADKDGPNTNVLTAYYSYFYLNDSSLFAQVGETIQYTVGSGWGGEFYTDWGVVEGSTRLGGPPGTEDVVMWSMDMMWSDKLGKLCLVGRVLSINDSPWDVFQLNDDGDQWEFTSDLSPGVISMREAQSRNTISLGPDGNIYRAMIGAGGIFGSDEPRMAKHDPSYLARFSNAAHRAPGEIAQWMPFMYSTTHVPIRIVGQEAYVLYNLSTESMAWEDGDERWADGFFMFKCDYVPCGGVIPLFRPRVFSVSLA